MPSMLPVLRPDILLLLYLLMTQIEAVVCVLLQPLQNNWFLYIILGVTFLVALSYITGSI